jgi:hypothetical protein
VVVPDGRILLHRNIYKERTIGSPWCATVNTPVSLGEGVEDSIKYRLRALFEIETKGRTLDHIMSHTITPAKLSLEVYRLSLQSMTRLHLSKRTEIVSLSFRDLIANIRKDSALFTDTTKTAFNIISRAQAIGDG